MDGNMPSVKHSFRTLSVPALLTSLSVLMAFGSVTPAAASVSDDPAVEAAILEVRESLPAGELVKFDALSEADQDLFVKSITDLDAYDFVVVEDETSVMPDSPSARAATKTYSKVFTVNAELFGITTGQYRQEIRYSVNGSTTKAPHFCSGTFTGWAGFWSISTSNSSWVSGNKAYCSTNYTLSVLWQGNSAQMNKQMQQTGTSGGSISGYLKNI